MQGKLELAGACRVSCKLFAVCGLRCKLQAGGLAGDACYYRGIAPVRVWGLSLTKPLDLAWQDCLDSDDGSCQHPMTLTSQSYECRQSSRT